MSLFNVAFDRMLFRKDGSQTAKSLHASVGHFPGVGPLTLIETDFGSVPAQALRVRDRVRVRNGLYCPIVHIDKLLLDQSFLERHPAAQPILVEPGKLGEGVPSEPILLAPGQELSSQLGIHQTSRTASNLCSAGAARRHFEQFMTYVVFSFPEPEDVCSSGLWLHVKPSPVQPDCDGRSPDGV